MKVIKKLFLLGIVSCFIFGTLLSTDRPWHPNQTYTIPDDGYTYTLDWSFSLTDDLLISGTLKILATTNHDVALTNNDNQITIGIDGILTLTAGWGTDGTDATDIDGTNGVNGKNISLVNNGIITVDGILTITGGKGGNGGNGGTSGSGNTGGNGGDGGDATVSGTGHIIVTIEGNLNLHGGSAGNGGNGGSGTYSNFGGTGGRGGTVTINSTITLSVASGANLTLHSGSGGNGGDGGSGTSGNSGGNGGYQGGNANLYAKATITIANGGSLILNGGNGGNGGMGGSVGTYNSGGYGYYGGYAPITNTNTTLTLASGGIITLSGGTGGNGGTGGSSGSNNNGRACAGSFNVLMYNLTFIAHGGTLNISGGHGGNGGATGAGGSGGDGGHGGGTYLMPTENLLETNNTIINMTGGDGGNQGASSGGAGGDGGTSRFDPTQYNPAETTFLVKTKEDISTIINVTDGSDGSGTTGGAGFIPKGLFGEIIAHPQDQYLYDLNLSLSQQLEINFTWTITQNQTIWGNGNSISLGPNGAIVINDNVMFYLDNLEIENVAGNNIRCLGNNSRLILNNVAWTQSADYTFTKGILNIDGNCTIDGAYTTFTLESIIKPVIIATGASLTFLTNTTFVYDTSPNNLVVLSRETSTLGLNNATLIAKQDLKLQKGILSSDGLAIVQGIGTLSLVGLNNIVTQGRIAAVGDVVW